MFIMDWTDFIAILIIQLCIIVQNGTCENSSDLALHACVNLRDNSTFLSVQQYEMPPNVMSTNISTLVRFTPLTLKCDYTRKISFSLVPDPDLDPDNAKSDGSFGLGGVLQYDSEYFWNTEFCISNITKSVITLQVCEISCDGEVAICVHKCCPMGKTFHGSKCVPDPEAELWLPQVYHDHSVHECLQQRNTSESCVHEAIPPEKFHYTRFNPTCEEYAQHTPYFSHEEPFAFLKNSTLVVYDKRLTKFNYCLDGALDDFGNRTHLLLACGCPEPPMNNGVSILYIFGMFLSSFFLLLTVLVYLLIWSTHNIHGWTVFSLSVSMFFMLIYLGTSRSMQLTMHRDDVADSTSCFFVAFTTHYFFLSTFCWLTTLSFDLWWTFRSLSPVSGRSKGLERFLYYALFAVGLPMLIVAIGIMLDKFSSSEDMQTPQYGTESCFIGDATSFRYWVIVPVGILLFFNLFFFGWTMFKMYQYQKNADAVRTNSNKQRQTALLFAKLFLVMGVKTERKRSGYTYLLVGLCFLNPLALFPMVLFAFSVCLRFITWSFEIIENLTKLNQISKDERGCEIHHGGGASWIVTDLINLFQGIAIFIIFVCKRQILIHLWRKQEILRVCINPFFRLPCCSNVQLDLERSASGAKTTHSTLSMRQLSTHRSISVSENM